MGSSGFGQIFSKHTQAIFYNWKQNPVQRMLDFDFLCGEQRFQETRACTDTRHLRTHRGAKGYSVMMWPQAHR